MSTVQVFRSIDENVVPLASIHLGWQDFSSQRPDAFSSGTSSFVVTINIPLTQHRIQFARETVNLVTLSRMTPREPTVLCFVELTLIDWWLLSGAGPLMKPIRELPCICPDGALQSGRKYWNTAHSSTGQHKHIKHIKALNEDGEIGFN